MVDNTKLFCKQNVIYCLVNVSMCTGLVPVSTYSMPTNFENVYKPGPQKGIDHAYS